MIRTKFIQRMSWPSRMMRTVLAALIAFGALVATAATASAQENCTGVPGSHSICLSIEDIGNNDYAVHIGIDRYMSRQDAEAILAGSSNPVWAKLYGDDSWYDNFLKYVPLTWAAASDGGLSAEFDGVVDGCVLNEDWEGGDEVYGTVFIYDARSRVTSAFNTGVISGSYHC